MKIYKNLDIYDLENEIWKVIEDHPDYQISNLGRVKSFKYDKINGKIRKQYKDKDNYFKIDLWKSGEPKTKRVHRLVFESHNNYKLKDDEDVHHLDEEPENNIYENLESVLKSEHCSFHNKGENNPMFGVHRFGENAPNFGVHRFGENAPNFGNHHSKESKLKMSEKIKEKFKNEELNYRGENNPVHKLTEENVIQIKLLLKEGKLTQQEIADIFKVSQITISNIKTGKIWSYIKI